MMKVRAYVYPRRITAGKDVLVIAQAGWFSREKTKYFDTADGGQIVKLSVFSRLALVKTSGLAPGVYEVKVHAERGWAPDLEADTAVWFEVIDDDL
jgi:hypothetical protein